MTVHQDEMLSVGDFYARHLAKRGLDTIAELRSALDKAEVILRDAGGPAATREEAEQWCLDLCQAMGFTIRPGDRLTTTAARSGFVRSAVRLALLFNEIAPWPGAEEHDDEAE